MGAGVGRDTADAFMQTALVVGPVLDTPPSTQLDRLPANRAGEEPRQPALAWDDWTLSWRTRIPAGGGVGAVWPGFGHLRWA